MSVILEHMDTFTAFLWGVAVGIFVSMLLAVLFRGRR